MFARYSGAGLIAAVVTTALLFLMQMLVAQDSLELTPHQHFQLKDIFWEGDPPLKPRRITPEKPVLAAPEPKPDVRESFPPIGTEGAEWKPEPFTRETEGPDSTGPELAVANIGGYPKFRVPHHFPRRAQSSACVVYGFTVTKTGGTRDIHVIDSSARMFNREGEKAIAQYRYEPLFMNGRPVEAPLQSIRLVWEMEGEALPDHSACR